jgi:arylsulfatase A-like enzyme
MTRRDFLRESAFAAAVLGALGALTPFAHAQARKPNIISILIDDMGWMDTETYGSQYYETPNITRLAQRGMLFTDAYAPCPLCSPTRGSIMTGKYPARLKMTTASGGQPTDLAEPTVKETGPASRRLTVPDSRTQLPLEEFTLAEALKQQGYHTGFIGKWHLGQEPFWPDKQGFDVAIASGHYPGPPNYFSPYGITTLPDGPEGEYITDRLTNEAVNYISQQKDNPFLLCLWHYGVHSPWNAKPEKIEKYKAKTDPRGKQHNPVVAGIIESIDESVGRLLDHLDALGLSENTIITFTSDNGQLENVPKGKGEIRKNTPLQAGDHVSSNFPLRAGKASIYEGGTRVPLIVAWPGHVQPASRSSVPVSLVDLYPTFIEAGGAATQEGQIVDGVTLRPVLEASGTYAREAVFCHFPHYNNIPNAPSSYVRRGDWKLIRFYEGDSELYNLKDDISESNNQFNAQPELVKELGTLLDKFLADTGALLPKPNPNFGKEGGKEEEA